jgi:hypothetical protein
MCGPPVARMLLSTPEREDAVMAVVVEDLTRRHRATRATGDYAASRGARRRDRSRRRLRSAAIDLLRRADTSFEGDAT